VASRSIPRAVSADGRPKGILAGRGKCRNAQIGLFEAWFAGFATQFLPFAIASSKSDTLKKPRCRK